MAASVLVLGVTLFFLIHISWSKGDVKEAHLKSPGTTRNRHKRDLPLNLACDVRSSDDANKCYKGDLINTDVADCKKAPIYNPFSCDPVEKKSWSTSVNVPDVSAHGVDCVPRTSRPVTCGTMDTRCVCDDPWDITSPQKRPYFANHCRCQYWPASDERESRPAVCKQYDHGGVSGVHFYACCNNCNDPVGPADRFCDGDTYQGGGTTDTLCGKCGERVASEKESLLSYTFSCGSCTKQRNCRDTCNTAHPIAKDRPGLCPLWLGCFRGCCLSLDTTYRGRRSVQVNNVSDFCGDNTCSSGETTGNCPSDCCPTVNPRCSPKSAGQCPGKCCLNWGCCLVNETTVTLTMQTYPASPVTAPTTSSSGTAIPGPRPTVCVSVSAFIIACLYCFM